MNIHRDRGGGEYAIYRNIRLRIRREPTKKPSPANPTKPLRPAVGTGIKTGLAGETNVASDALTVSAPLTVEPVFDRAGASIKPTAFVIECVAMVSSFGTTPDQTDVSEGVSINGEMTGLNPP